MHKIKGTCNRDQLKFKETKIKAMKGNEKI